MQMISNLASIALLALQAGNAPPITSIAFTPDGQAIVTGSQSGVEVRSWPDLTHLHDLETTLANVHDIAFSPSGDLLAVCGGEPGVQGQTEFYEWPKRKRIHVWKGHDDLVYSVAWSSNSHLLTAASADRQVSLNNITQSNDSYVIKSKMFLDGHSRSVTAVTILPNDSFILSAGIDQSLRLRRASDGKLLRTLDQHTAAVNALAVRPKTDPTRPMVASASTDRTIRLWQPTIGRLVRFAKLPVEPLAIAWTPSGDRLLAACQDGKLRVVDPDTVEIIAEHSAIDGWAYSLASSPSGKHALVGGAGGQLKVIVLTAE